MLERLLLRNVFSSFIWSVPRSEPVLYLTFDDGPIPEVTPWTLQTLDAHQAKATFFCVGENVQKHQAIYKELLHRGHATGNHTMHHLNGWKTSTTDYLEDVEQCAEHVPSDLFRPPYGRISRSQWKGLRSRYRCIMWDVLSRDYDATQTPADCIRRVIRRAQPGSIVVFHDSVKAWPRLKEALPAVLEHFGKQGYRFEKME